jgi:hypothetical protein
MEKHAIFKKLLPKQKSKGKGKGKKKAEKQEKKENLKFYCYHDSHVFLHLLHFKGVNTKPFPPFSSCDIKHWVPNNMCFFPAGI